MSILVTPINKIEVDAPSSAWMGGGATNVFDNIVEVDGNIDKLLLTGTSAGTVVNITEEGGRIEQYFGALVDSSDTVGIVNAPDILVVTGPYAGIYYRSTLTILGYPVYENAVLGTIKRESSYWVLLDVDSIQVASGGGVEVPWGNWSDGTGIATPTPEMFESNWNVLRNTISLTIESLSSNIVFDGVEVGSGAPSAFGWINDNQFVPFETPTSEIMPIFRLEAGTVTTIPTLTNEFHGETASKIQIPRFPRAAVVYLLM